MPYVVKAVLFYALMAACAAPKEKTTNTTTIAFGSCSHEDDSLQAWEAMAGEKPDLVILTGDNIYADTEDMALMAEKYKLQKSRRSYQRLMEEAPVIGTWDDHDYGLNDSGKHYRKKDSSKLLMLDFFDVPDDDPVRTHNGVYREYSLKNGDHSIKVILLDTRYFRDTLYKDMASHARYLPNKEGDMLGEAQWQWLENELNRSEADINLLVSSIQFIAEEHPYEKWANFPKARERMLKLLEKVKPKFTLFISGDRHIAELSKMQVYGLNYPLYDFTSSGLTHTWNEIGREPNKYRIGDMLISKNYGIIKINWVKDEINFIVKNESGTRLMNNSIFFNK